MKKQLNVLLSLDKETNDILKKFSEVTHLSKSRIIRYILSYLNKNTYDLDRIIGSEDDKFWMKKIERAWKKQIDTLKKGWK